MDGWPTAERKSGCLRCVFKKLCFRDGSEWMVGLTVETKLRFQIPLE